MALNTTQLQTLKADIAADPTLAAKPHTEDGAYDVARAYHVVVAPPFIVWKTTVPVGQVGDCIDGTEMAGLTQVNVTRLSCIVQLSPLGVNPSLEDRRQFFDDIFSGGGGAITRGKLATLWKRSANRGEKLYATNGSGTDASPSTMTFEGAITSQDVQNAWRA